VRTDPDAPPHRGISVLIVDTRDPGFSSTPIVTSDHSHHTNATYFNDVRVPVDMLVGEENRGWQLITTQLNHERVMLGPAGRIEGLRDLVREWAQGRVAPDGTPLLEVPCARRPRACDGGVPGQRAAQLGRRPWCGVRSRDRC
jgi:alkylation response protein AidB-like acyl-CoA dehydrogenase